MKIHNVQKIDFKGTKMVLKAGGHTFLVDLLLIFTRLANAEDAARRSYSISPSGDGVHWPELDEDLTLDGLIAAATPLNDN